MTQQELDELCGKTDVTSEMLMKLKNEEWYFAKLFNGNVSPNMREPLREWTGEAEKKP